MNFSMRIMAKKFGNNLFRLFYNALCCIGLQNQSGNIFTCGNPNLCF